MASSLVLYQSWVENLAKSANLSSDSFVVGLTSSTYTPSASTHSTISDITNELSGSGYSRQAIGSVTFSRSGAVVTLDGADVVFTASGGSIVARYFFIFDDTVSGDPLVGYGLLDTAPADVTVTTGNTLTLAWNASGITTNTIV